MSAILSTNRSTCRKYSILARVYFSADGVELIMMANPFDAV